VVYFLIVYNALIFLFLETTLEEVLLDEGELTPKALNPDDFAFDDIYDLVIDPAENGTFDFPIVASI
jgi:hypothetical protein